MEIRHLKFLGEVAFGLPFLLFFLACSGQKKLFLKEERRIHVSNSPVSLSNWIWVGNKLYGANSIELSEYDWNNGNPVKRKKFEWHNLSAFSPNVYPDFEANSFYVVASDENKYYLYFPYKDSLKRTYVLPREILTLQKNFMGSFLLSGNIFFVSENLKKAIVKNMEYLPIYVTRLHGNRTFSIIDTLKIPIPSNYEPFKYKADKFFYPYYHVGIGGYNPKEKSFVVGFPASDDVFKVQNIKFNKDSSRIFSYEVKRFKTKSEYFFPDSIRVFRSEEQYSKKDLANYIFQNGEHLHIVYDTVTETYFRFSILPSQDFEGFDYSYYDFSVMAFDNHFHKIGEYVFAENHGKLLPSYATVHKKKLIFFSGEAARKERFALYSFFYSFE